MWNFNKCKWFCKNNCYLYNEHYYTIENFINEVLNNLDLNNDYDYLTNFSKISEIHKKEN